MSDSEVVEGLDKIAAILLLAFSEQLSNARERIRADKISAALLDATDDRVGAGELKQKIAAATSMTERSVATRLSELKDQKVLIAKSQGAATLYKSSGIL